MLSILESKTLKSPEWHTAVSDNVTIYWKIDQSLEPASIYAINKAIHDVIVKNQLTPKDQKKIDELVNKSVKKSGITGFTITRIERKK